MTVRELIELLQSYPQDIQVAYCCYSEQCLLESHEVRLYDACPPRPDGWIQDKRPDMTTQQYLLFPGN